jgi:hypothetical protein
MTVNEVFWDNHPFGIYQFGDLWNDVGGIYIFAGPNYLTGRWGPWYVGQTDSFRNRIPQHEKWIPAVLRGATHVHAMVAPLADMRLAVEQRLIATFQPPLNVQHRSLADYFQPLPIPRLGLGW